MSKAQARADRKAFRTDARLRLKTEMGANGAMFRGYRACPWGVSPSQPSDPPVQVRPEGASPWCSLLARSLFRV